MHLMRSISGLIPYHVIRKVCQSTRHRMNSRPPTQQPGQPHQIRPGQPMHNAPPVAAGPSHHYAKPRGPGGSNRYPQGGNQGGGYNPNRGGQGGGYGSGPYPQQARGPPPYPPQGGPYGASGPGRGPNYPQSGSHNQQQYGNWQ